MRAQLVFNIWESRAFIAKGIINHPEVKEALANKVIAIGRGITNAYIIKEMLHVTGNTAFDIDLNNYVAGVIDGSLWISHPDTRTPELAFYKGRPKFEPMTETIQNADIVLKGGNAIGTDWVAGVLCAHPEGGTMGIIYAKAISKGIKILVPLSIEKMIPFPLSDLIQNLGGQNQIDYVRGIPVGLFPIVGGEIFSEIEAIETLANDIDVFPIGAGGVYAGAGSTIFEIKGTDEEIEKILNVYKEIQNTEPVKINLKPH